MTSTKQPGPTAYVLAIGFMLLTIAGPVYLGAVVAGWVGASIAGVLMYFGWRTVLRALPNPEDQEASRVP